MVKIDDQLEFFEKDFDMQTEYTAWGQGNKGIRDSMAGD